MQPEDPSVAAPPAPHPASPSADAVGTPADPHSAVAEPSFARPFELGIIGIIVVLDQITKALLRSSLSFGESRTLIPGLLDLTHVQNTGAAFGLLNSVEFPYKPVVMLVVASLALVAIALYGTQLGFQDRLARVGLALILGGAFGNLLDRIIHGHVVDFVDVYWGDTHFWAFNVADAAISVGAVLVLLDMIGVGRRHASHTV
jgi:signal peptidase II